MKRKLFLLLCALLTMIGVQAQKDVTSQYITNATLSSLNGWTNVNFNAPQRGNNTVGYASECYAGWGSLEKTNYSLTQDITLPAGHYTLVNYSFFRYGLNADTDASKSLAYLKAGDNQVAIKTLGSITAAGYANNQEEGANCFDSKMYRNTLDFTIDADNTVINIGLVGTFDLKQSWMIAGMFELINNDIPATMDAPFDVTGYITNPGFEYRDMSGWTVEPGGYFGTQNNNQGFKVGGYYAEKWQGSGALPAGSATQTIQNLPAGYYKLTANLGGNGTYVDLNGKTASWTADKDYTVGYVLSENEDLTITFGKTAEGTANWIHFDNFRLQFCGDVQAALTTLIAQQTTYKDVIPAAAYAQLCSDVNVYDKSYSDVDELLAAIAAVQNLYTAADLLKAPFAAFNALKAKAETLAGVPNTNSDANAVLVSAIATQNTAANNATTADGINTTTDDLKTAMSTYVWAADPTEGNRFDLTFMLTNPDLTGLPTWTGAAGWYTDQTDGNSQVMTNDGVKSDDGKDAFYEYWSEAAKDNNQFTLYQKLTLPAGTYAIKCYAFSDQPTGGDTRAVYFYANDTQGSLVNNSKLTEQGISFVNDEEQEVKIGLKALSGNKYRWMGIGYVELYKEYTDNTAYNINIAPFEKATVAVIVDEAPATSAKALKTVTLNYSEVEEGCYVSNVEVTYNDGEVKNVDVANPDKNVYTFQMPAYDVTVNTTVTIDKTQLAASIAAAEATIAAVPATSIGTRIFQYKEEEVEARQAKIDAAKLVYNDPNATPAQINQQVNILASETTPISQNVPGVDDKFYLKRAGAETTADLSSVKLTDGIVPVYFTAVDGGYKISSDKTNFVAYKGGDTWSLSTTTEGGAVWAVAYISEGKYTLTSTNGRLGTDNTTVESSLYGNKKESDGDKGLWYIYNAAANLKVADGKLGTFIAPFDVTLPDNVKAYSATVVNNEVKLSKIAEGGDKLDAGTPVVVYGDGVSANSAFFNDAIVTENKTVDNLVGILNESEKTVPIGAYVLQTQTDVQAFYKVTSAAPGALNRCYVTTSEPSSGARLTIIFDGEDPTAINAIEAAETEDGALKDGKYLIDGKVILVKNGVKYSANGQILK